MAVIAANGTFLCTSPNGAKIRGGNGSNTSTFAFTPKPGVGGGGVRVLTASDNSTPIQWAVYTTGTDIAIRGGANPDFYVNVMITDGAVRSSVVPALDETAVDRNLYAVNSTTGVARFVGTIRADNTPTDNGAGDRIRLSRGTNSTQDVADVNGLLAAGDQVFLADAGDNGLSTSFAASPARTTATTFSLHGVASGVIEQGDTVSSATPFSVTEVNL